MRDGNEPLKTAWKSVWICTFLHCVFGIQFGIYILITWPYLIEIDPSATAGFLGWIVSSASVGSVIFNPVFGWWTQRTASTKHPVSLGFAIACIGSFLYIVAPSFNGDAKWCLLAARFVMGCGQGCVTSIRSYIAAASTADDRLRAVSYSNAGYSIGCVIGGLIPSIFTLVPASSLGALPLNTYSMSAMSMVLLCIVCVVLMNTVFEERYVAILSEEEKQAHHVCLPRADVLALLICCYANFLLLGFESGIEGTQSPVTMSLFDWSSEDAVRWNGIISSIGAGCDLITYTMLTQTRFGRVDRRKQLMIGVGAFAVFFFLFIPWPVYGTLEQKRQQPGTFSGRPEECERYPWCPTSHRLPVWIYAFMRIVLYSVSYPMILATVNTLVTEILGPRKQGMWQGGVAFSGSVGQFIAPITMTELFEYTGYVWITVGPFSLCCAAIALICIFYKRLIPLKIIQQV